MIAYIKKCAVLKRGLVVGLLAVIQVHIAHGAIRWDKNILKKPSGWYSSAEARAVADSVIQYQSPQGGWPKSTDLAAPPRNPDDVPAPGRGRANSLDNDATTVPMQFLARVANATNEAKYRGSFLRGVDYLLAAQYSNGGWPQFWPLRDGYYSRVTYNDGAMIRVMSVLRDISEGEPPYGFVDDDIRVKAAAAVERGIECILKTQIKQNGKLTAWCAQYDEKTLEPAWARAYEPPSLSGAESVGITRFLMSIDKPTPKIVAAVEGAVAWFESAVMKGVVLKIARRDDGRNERWLEVDPDAAPLWARFYELKTNRPLYLDRDSVFRYDFSEISYERRSGYSYHGTWPERVLKSEYAIWRKKHTLN